MLETQDIFFFILDLWNWSNETVSGASKYVLKAVIWNHKFSELKGNFKITKPVFLQMQNRGSEKLKEFPKGIAVSKPFCKFQMWT